MRYFGICGYIHAEKYAGKDKMPFRRAIDALNLRFGLLLALFFVFSLFAQSAPAQSSSGRNIRSKYAYGRAYLYISDIAKYYGMTLTVGSTACEIRNSKTRVTFIYDKRNATINGVKMHFLFPVLGPSSCPALSSLDFNNVLDPSMRVYSIPKQTVKTILIDPGHGADDKGASGRISHEKNLNLQISLKLRALLVKKGFKVFMTRQKDAPLTLEQRSSRCISVGADIFISVHCNSTSKRDISGIETFCLTPEGAPSTPDRKPVSAKYRGNSFNKNNFLLALKIQSKLLMATKAADRGVKHARFEVLRNAPCPAVLVEAGFMSNSREEGLLVNSAYQDKVAKAIADGIVSYYDALRGR